MKVRIQKTMVNPLNLVFHKEICVVTEVIG